MRFRSLAVSSFALMLAAVSGAAQQPAAEPSAHLTHAQGVADARSFVTLLELSHPDPYTNLGGKVAFKRKAMELVRAIPPDGLSVDELATRLGRFIAPLRDGHTRLNLYHSKWRNGGSPIAVRFQTASDAIFIAGSDLPELKGTRGYKVVGVNGHSMPELLRDIAAKVSAENEYGDYRTMVNVLQSYDLLKLLLPDDDLSHGVTLNLQTPTGARLNKTLVRGGTHSADPDTWLEKPVRWAGLDRSSDLFYYRMLDHDRTAYLRVSAMGGREGTEILLSVNRGSKTDMEQRVRMTYQRMGVPEPANWEDAVRGLPSVVDVATRMLNEMKRKGTQNLIIDIRGNGGGATGIIIPVFYEIYGDDYFAMHYPDRSATVVSQIYMDVYNMTVEKERAKDPGFEIGEYRFDEDADTVRGPDRARIRREAKIAQWKERKHAFISGLKGFDVGIDTLDGRPLYRPKHVVVLVDPATFSAAFQMEFYLKGLGAKLVGVPSAQSPNTFMEITPFTLPISHLAGSISNGTQVFMPETPSANVLPLDVNATYSVFRKYGFDEDTSLRYALDLLSAGKIQ